MQFFYSFSIKNVEETYVQMYLKTIHFYVHNRAQYIYTRIKKIIRKQRYFQNINKAILT